MRSIDAQAPLEDKAAVADFLVDNGGTLAELENQVERLWHDIPPARSPELPKGSRTPSIAILMP